MQELPLYTGADRGHFKVVRLTDQTGLHLDANCRIREATVFNYLSDLRYAIIGYVIEYWEEGAPAPHEGGVATSFIPNNRPNIQRLYMRAKASVTRKMLYLEDAIINDFLMHKVLADPMSFQSFNQEAQEQVASAAQWRPFDRHSPYMYNDAVHITRLRADENSPLTIIEQGMRFNWRTKDASENDFVSEVIKEYEFVSSRECLEQIMTHIQASVSAPNL